MVTLAADVPFSEVNKTLGNKKGSLLNYGR
jgi:hypothetical protein